MLNKRFLNLSLLFIWFTVNLSANTGKNSSTGGIRISDLQCEYMTNPLGIDTETPHFSWKINDAASVRGQHQTAYRILAASSLEKLKKNKADVWDSGIVSSEQSHLILYGGPKLRSGGDYYWKVMVYDKDKKPSGWSAIARFSMGLLQRSDWKGEWIKQAQAKPEKHIWFRKKWTLSDKTASAFAYVASIGYHELYVNGQKVDNRVLAPAISRIDKRILYVTYDIASLLRKGDNVIALWYAPGWSRNDFFEPFVDQAVLLQVNGQTERGGNFTLHSDESWKCTESYSWNTGLYKFNSMGGEGVDGRLFTENWNRTDYKDEHWSFATKINPLKKGGELELSAQMTDPSRIIDTIPARQIIDTIPGVWRVDMGKSFAGYIEARFDQLKAGDTVFIKVSNITSEIEEFGQTQCYIARGEKGETFCNRFNFFAGRYVHFIGLNQPPKLTDVRGYAVSSAAQRTGYFECSDPMFNRIYEVDRWTYEMCNTEGVTVDCPNRERLGYGPEGAYQTTWGLGLPCFSSAAYYMKNVRDWSDVQSPNGHINNVAPQISSMYGGTLNGGANMNIAWEHYLAYGDKRILEAVYGSGKKWLDFLNTYVSDGMLTPYDTRNGYFLGEWVSPGPRFEMSGDSVLFFNNCVYAMTLDLFIRIAEELGKNSETSPYRERLETVRAKTHEKYFNPAVNSYLDGDQVRTASALFAGILPKHLHQAAVNHLERDMTESHPYFNIGSFTRYQYFHVLFAHPQFHEIIAGILSKTTCPGYGYFLSQDETAWPEVWEIKWKSSARIHTSYAGISAWFIKGLSGIEPDKTNPGYRIFTVCPNIVGKLDYARTGLESPYGLIESAWRKKENQIVYNITVPVGSKANIYLPSPVLEITESGLPLEKVQGVKVLGEKNGRIWIQAESGKYEFLTNRSF